MNKLGRRPGRGRLKSKRRHIPAQSHQDVIMFTSLPNADPDYKACMTKLLESDKSINLLYYR